MAATDSHATVEELLQLLQAVFSVRYVPRLYTEGQLSLQKCLETVVRKVRSWYETAASSRERESETRGTFTGESATD
jgi:hypothetical protein